MSIPALPDLTEATTAVLDEAGLPELDSMTAVDPSDALPAVPAQTTAAEPVTGGAVAAPPPEPAAEAPVEAAPAVIPAPDAPPVPDVAQTAPTNINVSVRVNSPGDNGAVEQANAALAAAAGSATASAPQYQPEPPQYQAPIPASATPTPDAAPQTPSVEPVQAGDGWSWDWEWNCGDANPEMAIPPEVGTQDWIWNWNWNCGTEDPVSGNSNEESTPQYQPGVTQYRPININISIRINSAGNDGPVTQTNVAVVVTAPTLPRVRIEVPAAPPAQGSPAHGESAPAAPELTSPLAFIAEIVADVFADPAETTGDGDECCVANEPTGIAIPSAEPQSLLLPQAPPRNRRDITAKDRFSASVAVTVRLAKASEAAARVARPAPKPAQLRPAPRHSDTQTRQTAAAISAAGFAPQSAPDGRLGFFMALVVGLAFVFAFADACRSVAAELRVAGEDPDRPPDHPG